MSLKLHCLVLLSFGLFKYNYAHNSEYEYLQAIIAETNPPPLPTLPPFFNETFTFPDGIPIPPDLLDRFYRFTRYPTPNVPPWETKGRNNQGKFGLNNKHSFPANSIYFTFGFGVAMFFLGIFVVVSVYLCVMYCKKFLTERVNYLYRQQLLHNNNNNNNMSSSISNSNNLILNQHPQINNHIIDIDLLPNNNNSSNNCIISNNINNNSNHSNNSNSSYNNLLLSSSSQQDKPIVVSHSQSHQKEELHEQLMINLECIEMIDINNPSYEPQVIQQPNLYVNTYTNKGNITKGNNTEDVDNDSQDDDDDEDETPEGEEVPNASHDLIIDE